LGARNKLNRKRLPDLSCEHDTYHNHFDDFVCHLKPYI
jgi:hypothetical protein